MLVQATVVGILAVSKLLYLMAILHFGENKAFDEGLRPTGLGLVVGAGTGSWISQHQRQENLGLWPRGDLKYHIRKPYWYRRKSWLQSLAPTKDSTLPIP